MQLVSNSCYTLYIQAVIIASCLVQYWKIFCCYFTRLKVHKISCKIWVTQKVFPILRWSLWDNNYLSSKTKDEVYQVSVNTKKLFSNSMWEVSIKNKTSLQEDNINHYKPDKNDDGNKTDETIKKLPQLA